MTRSTDEGDKIIDYLIDDFIPFVSARYRLLRLKNRRFYLIDDFLPFVSAPSLGVTIASSGSKIEVFGGRSIT